MDKFQSILFKFLINHCIVNITIINNGKVKPQTVDFLKPPFRERFTERLIEKSPDLKATAHSSKAGKARRKPEIDLNLLKLEGDISFLREMLETMAKSSFSPETFQTLTEKLISICNEFRAEFEIIESNAKHSKLLVYMERKLKKDEEKSKEILLKCEEKIFDLGNDIRELEIENVVRLNLVTKWERTRHEQTQTLFNRDMKSLKDKSEKASLKFNQEMRIYNEIEVYTHNEVNKLQRLTDEYIERYNNEVATLDQELKTAKAKIETTQECTHNYQQLFDKRNQEIDDYLEHKRLMEEARRIEQLKWDSAVRIQAWWRGTMVRNCLGPYRRKKKSKKGKSAKKKK